MLWPPYLDLDFACEQREEAINWFYDKWHTEELVIDKWFTVQALSRLPNTLDEIKKLTQHEKFDLTNPNRMRSLIGAFCHGNQNQFNRLDGKGYELCAFYVLKLDAINPQIADDWLGLSTVGKFGEDRKQLSGRASS